MSDCLHGRNSGPVEPGGVQDPRQPSREELMEQLADYLARWDGQSDPWEVERYLEAIEQTGPLAPDLDVERSLADFHRKHGIPSVTPGKEKRRFSPRLLRSIMARVAIIATLLFATLAVVQASGFDIFGAIARWTDSQFHFYRPDSDDIVPDASSQEWSSLQKALDSYGIDVPLAPTVLPEDIQSVDIKAEDKNRSLVIFATYILSDGQLSIIIREKTDIPYSESEKDPQIVDTYIVNNIEHKIMNDLGRIKVSWSNGPWECTIYGEISEDEAYAMIDSIYK